MLQIDKHVVDRPLLHKFGSIEQCTLMDILLETIEGQ